MPSVDARRMDALEAELLEAGEGARGGAFGRRREYLRLARAQRVRRPEAVATIGAELLSRADDRAALGDELYVVYEQVCLAACDFNAPELVSQTLSALQAKFPDSARVARLQGMAFEARGDYDAAEKVYADLLEKDKTNADAMKRRAALARARSGPIDAIKRLNEYLENYAADQEAWAELAELYLELSMYKQAAFCLEELVLAAPHEQKRHLRYAEVLYTMGGAENVLAAKRYFAAAVELGGGHGARALYGLAACAQALRGAGNKHARSAEEAKLFSLAANRIKSLYRQADSPHAEMVADVLTSLGCYDKPKGGARSADDETTSAMTT